MTPLLSPLGRRFAIAMGLTLALAVELPAAADPVDVLYEEGVAAAQAGQRELAYEKLRAAWALRQTYDIAANLAIVENALSKHRDAAEHFQFALENFPPVGDQSERTKLQAGLAAARKKVGELTITVAAGSVVEVNGKVVGTAPLKSPVFVEPGQATVNCKKKDFGEGKALVEVRVGEAQEVRVEITIGDSGGGDEGKPIWPAIVLGVVGAAGIGSGIGLIVAARTGISGYEDTTCPGDGNTCPQDVQDAASQHNTFIGVGSVLAGVGAAAAIGMGIYVAVGGGEETAPGASAQIVPIAGPDTNGLLFRVRW